MNNAKKSFYDKHLVEGEFSAIQRRIDNDANLEMIVIDHITRPMNGFIASVVEEINREKYGRPPPIKKEKILRDRMKKYNDGNYRDIIPLVTEKLVYREMKQLIEDNGEFHYFTSDDPRVGLAFSRGSNNIKIVFGEYPYTKSVLEELEREQSLFKKQWKNLWKEIEKYNKKYALNLALSIYTQGNEKESSKEIVSEILSLVSPLVTIDSYYINFEEENDIMRSEHTYWLKEPNYSVNINNRKSSSNQEGLVEQVLKEWAIEFCSKRPRMLKEKLEMIKEDLFQKWDRAYKTTVEEVRLRSWEKLKKMIVKNIIYKRNVAYEKIDIEPCSRIIFDYRGSKHLIILRPFYPDIAGPKIFPNWDWVTDSSENENDALIERASKIRWLQSLLRRNYVDVAIKIIASGKASNEEDLKQIISDYSLSGVFKDQ